MEEPLSVYVGTYTGPRTQSRGVYLFRMDPVTGQLQPAGLAAESDNPSFLAIHPNRRFVYAVNEVSQFGGEKTGAVSAFAVDPATGKLSLRNQQPSGGAGPCHLMVDRAGRHVLAANYGGGSVAVLPIEADGRLGEPTSVVQHAGEGVGPGRQSRPHAHSIHLDAAERFALAVDLGLDKVMLYRFDGAAGKLNANQPAWSAVPPRSGPRHMAFGPDGRFAYVINELNSTVTAMAYDAGHCTLREVQTVSTLPAGFAGENSCAEVAMHPSGRFLYGSNRGHDSLAAFGIDEHTGRLTVLGHVSTDGKEPRHFALDPTGRWLIAANQNSNTLVVFRIDPQTGLPQPTGVAAEVPAPVCVRFLQP